MHGDVLKPFPCLHSTSLKPFQQDCLYLLIEEHKEKSIQTTYTYSENANDGFAYARAVAGVDLFSDLYKGTIIFILITICVKWYCIVGDFYWKKTFMLILIAFLNPCAKL